MLVFVDEREAGGIVVRTRLALEQGWAEWDAPYVRVGDRAMPERIEVTFPSTADKWPALTMTIEVRNGVPQCTEVAVRAHEDGREVRSVDLKAVRLEDWVEAISAYAAMDVVEQPDGSLEVTKTFYPSGSPVGERELRARRDQVRSARAAARRKITDELLELVAATYRANAGDRPVEAVRTAFATSPRTAARYVEMARQRGMLPPTTQGKVSI